MTVTPQQLTQGAYTIAANDGFATNAGPNQNSWLLWQLAKEIEYRQTINDVARANFLINRASSIYNPSFPARF
jgi:hypothetical protein